MGGFRGKTFKSLGKLSNGWTDWLQLWFTSADSSGNGHRLNPSRPSILQWAFRGGGVGGHKFKSLQGEAVKRLYRLAPNLVHVGEFAPQYPGAFRGGLGGHKFGANLRIRLGIDIG